jgi:PIN domain nuclease of toxin-antitoxin system
MICLVRREPGWERVAAFGNTCDLSAVNLVEVAYRLSRHGFPLDEVESVVRPQIGSIVPLDADLALLTSSVHQSTRDRGLSLADCACLALGMARRAVVVTADRKWSDLALEIDIVQIRGER